MLNQNITSNPPSKRNAGQASAGRNGVPVRRGNSFGYLVVDGQTNGFACAISKISGDGADIRVSGLMGIPECFDLYVEPEQVRYRCDVIAQRGGAVRVAFTGREENRRFRDLASRR